MLGLRMLRHYWGITSNPSALHSIQLPTDAPENLIPWTTAPHVSGFQLYLDFTSYGYYDHLGNEPVRGQSLSLSLPLSI